MGKAMQRGFLLLAGWLSIQALGAQPADATVDEILARVQTNTGQFESSLPDFVCDETIHSQRFDNGVLAREVIAESHFTGLQRRSGNLSFTETREFVTINDKPAAKAGKVRKIPVFGGGFSSILDQTFSAGYAPLHDFKITGRETFNGRAAIGMEFSTKPDQHDLRARWNNKEMIQRDTGKAWIDEETRQVMRIERRYLNLPPEFSGMVVTVDYGPVSIEGKPFWMPRKVECHQSMKSGSRGEFTAEYRNYRKFDVASGIVYEPLP
jgi:hypothetical protein